MLDAFHCVGLHQQESKSFEQSNDSKRNLRVITHTLVDAFSVISNTRTKKSKLNESKSTIEWGKWNATYPLNMPSSTLSHSMESIYEKQSDVAFQKWTTWSKKTEGKKYVGAYPLHRLFQIYVYDGNLDTTWSLTHLDGSDESPFQLFPKARMFLLQIGHVASCLSIVDETSCTQPGTR